VPLTFQRDEYRVYDGKLPLEPVERYLIYSGSFVCGFLSRERVNNGVRWHWMLTVVHDPECPALANGARDSIDEAKENFRDHWLRWVAWAGLGK
jgi:hypothetical protein